MNNKRSIRNHRRQRRQRNFLVGCTEIHVPGVWCPSPPAPPGGGWGEPSFGESPPGLGANRHPWGGGGWTSLAGTEDSSFHDVLKQTTELHWTLVPVELPNSVELACYRERACWHTVQKWDLNDVAPALPNATSSKPPGAQHTKPLQTTLRQAHVARVNRDYARAAMLQKDIQRIATQRNIPLCRPVSVTFPYITPSQRSSVATIVNHMVRRTTYSAWERQALRAHIRIVSSAPVNVRRAFERPSNTHEKHLHAPNASVLPSTSLCGLKQARFATWAVTMPFCLCTSFTTEPPSEEQNPSHASAPNLDSGRSPAYST